MNFTKILWGAFQGKKNNQNLMKIKMFALFPVWSWPWQLASRQPSSNCGANATGEGWRSRQSLSLAAAGILEQLYQHVQPTSAVLFRKASLLTSFQTLELLLFPEAELILNPSTSSLKSDSFEVWLFYLFSQRDLALQHQWLRLLFGCVN